MGLSALVTKKNEKKIFENKTKVRNNADYTLAERPTNPLGANNIPDNNNDMTDVTPPPPERISNKRKMNQMEHNPNTNQTMVKGDDNQYPKSLKTETLSTKMAKSKNNTNYANSYLHGQSFKPKNMPFNTHHKNLNNDAAFATNNAIVKDSQNNFKKPNNTKTAKSQKTKFGFGSSSRKQ